MKRKLFIFLVLAISVRVADAQNCNIASPYLDVQGPLNARGNIYTLNKSGNGWIPWATRVTSTSEATIDLSNINNAFFNGNVGIGKTISSSPLMISKATEHLIPTLEVIHVSGNSGCNGCFNIGQKISVTDNQGTNKSNIGLWINAKNALYNYAAIFENGNVGIGSTTPSEKIEIAGNLSFRSSGSSAYENLGTIYFKNIASTKINAKIWSQRGGNYYGDGRLIFETSPNDGGTIERMRIDENGNIGIGTSNTFGYKLAVNGTIGAKEVKVENTSAWPDFVFKPSYQLRPLVEVEQFIHTNKHLPEIPTEAEVKANGVALGEMNAKLLQKVEELTLYVIELNKKVEMLEKEVKTKTN